MRNLVSNDKTPEKLSSSQTKGIRTLLGDPRKAIVKLSIPMIVAMSAHTIYNMVDAIWVSGLGSDSLSAVGFYFPFFFIGLALSSGIGIGSGAALSRRIGAKDKEGADDVAVHTMVLMFSFVIPFTVVMLVLAEPMIRLMGAEGISLHLSVVYSRIMFSGLILTFFSLIGNSILRSEGDAKRPMVVSLGGAILNIILDPILIYGMNLGVAGAAWASVISMFFVSVVVFYWLFVQKKTFVSFRFKAFRLNKAILWDIGRVGLPASISMMSMSLMAFALTAIVARLGGAVGVAVYTTGWRVVSMATLPMIGVARAVTAVAAAAYGARDREKFILSYSYALKFGLAIESVMALITLIFAPQIIWIFTWSEKSVSLAPYLIEFLRVIWVIFPCAAVGMISSAMFQGAGQGLIALAITLVRTLVFTIPLAWFFGVFLEIGILGVWVGIAVAAVSFAPVALGSAIWYIRQHLMTPAGGTE